MNNINDNKKPTPSNNSKITFEASIGVIRAIVARTKKILKILEPIMFPKEIPTSFLDKAISVTKSSGKDVPIATTVIPIAFSEKPKISTRGIAPLSTNNFDPKYKITDPAIILPTDFFKHGSFSFSSSPSHDVKFGLKKLAII